jgi:hypothetical protein
VLFLPASVLAVTVIVLSLWLHFLYFMLLLGYSVHQLRLPVLVLSLLLFVAEFPPSLILLVFWFVLFFRMEIRILADLALVCSQLLMHLFLSVQRSMLHLLLLALIIILFALGDNSKLVSSRLPKHFSNLFALEQCLQLLLVLQIFHLTQNILVILNPSHLSWCL